MEDLRGAGSIGGFVRGARILTMMTELQSVAAGVDNHKRFFRINHVKNNMHLPSSAPIWREQVSFDLGNADAHGRTDSTGVVTAWKWPNALEGVQTDQLKETQKMIASGDWLESKASPKKWAGFAIMDVMGWPRTDVASQARAKSILIS
jgi:hypothetical protein